MRTLRWLTLGAVALVVVVLFVAFGSVGLVLTPTPAAAAVCPVDVGAVAPAQGLSPDQTRNAATIVAVGQRLGVPEYGWVVAVAVAWQESKLQNLAHGDDWWFGGAPGSSPSRGLFQQMPQYYAGVNVMDPEQAAAAFYKRLNSGSDYRGRPKADWRDRPLAQVAQEVQGSAFPQEYARHQALAERIVRDVTGVAVVSPTCRATTVTAGWALPFPAHRVKDRSPEHHSYPAVDLSLPEGQREPVFTMTPGVAAPMNEPDGCGLGVFVRDGGAEWLYCHLSEVHVRAGQQVAPGDQLGISGWSGHTEPPGPRGAHLHVQLRFGGALRCVQPVVDALKAGRVPPALGDLGTARPCVP